MLPAQRNKVDLSKLSPQEQQLFAKYGKLPTHKNILMKMQKERKYFDSGDYALSKAGVTPQSTVGTAIPNPENIPHASPGISNGHQAPSVSPTTSTSPVNRESSLSQINTRSTEVEDEDENTEAEKAKESELVKDSSPAMVTNTTVETSTSAPQGTTVETQEINEIEMTI